MAFGVEQKEGKNWNSTNISVVRVRFALHFYIVLHDSSHSFFYFHLSQVREFLISYGQKYSNFVLKHLLGHLKSIWVLKDKRICHQKCGQECKNYQHNISRDTFLLCRRTHEFFRGLIENQ